MKNFKKTIIALAVLVLLVSSMVVMVVTAEDAPAYTGDITEAQALLDKVLPPEDQNIPDQTDAMKNFYAYIKANPIDPETEGYAAFAASYNQKSLILLNRYYEVIAKQTDKTKRAEYVNTTYSYLDACPIAAGTPDPDGEGAYLAYDELATLLDAENFEIIKSYLADAESKAATDTAAGCTALKKVYTQLAARPVDPAIEGYADFELGYNTLSVQLAESFVEAMATAREAWIANTEDATNTAAYRTQLQTSGLPKLLVHLEDCPVDTEKYADLKARLDALDVRVDLFEVDRFSFLLVDYENLDLTDVANPETTKQTYLAKIQVLLADAVIAEDTEGYAEFLAKYTVEKKLADDAMEARRLALDKQNSFTQYELTEHMSSNDFSTTPWNVVHSANTPYTFGELRSDPNDPGHDSYMSVVNYSPLYTPAPYTYCSYPSVTNGLVVQYDCMLAGEQGKHFQKMTVNFRNGSASGLPFPQLFGFAYDSKNDSITLTNGAKEGTIADAGKVIPNVAAEGQWFNVIITFDYETATGKFYVNYEYMFDLYYDVLSGDKAELRFQANFTNQSVNYDNYITYVGTSYRDVNKMKISQEEQFLLYCDYFLDETVVPKVRNEAFVSARGLVSYIESLYEGKAEGELTETELEYKRLVGIIAEYNYEEEIVIPAKEANLEQIRKLVKKITDTEMISSNIKILNDAVKGVEAFIAANNDFIDKAHPDYIDAIRTVTQVKEDIIKCENVIVFAKALTQFTRATTYASMEKRKITADEIYALSKYHVEANRDFVAEDPVIVALEKLINGSVEKGQEGFVSAFEYYNNIPDTMAAQKKVENSKRVLDCIGFVDAIVAGEYNEEVYAANSEQLSFYMDIIRNIVSSDNYNPEADGIADAIAKFELIDEYFYKVLQDTHKKIISEQLAIFVESDTYIEKVGICTYLDKYFAENDIDMTDPEFVEYQYYLGIYKAELEAIKEMYADQVEENTYYFIAAVKKMDSVSTYADLKPLYEEALQYYYGMNVDSEDAKAAIAKFNDYEEKINLVAESSRLFADKAFFISLAQSSKDQDAIYNAIMDAMLYYQYTDATYSSTMQDSIDSYLEALEAYNAGADVINSEIEVVSGVVCSVRTNKISAVILAVINQFIKD